MARPPLPIGTWGSISTSVERTDDKGKPAAYRAKAKFRDRDGYVRPCPRSVKPRPPRSEPS